MRRLRALKLWSRRPVNWSSVYGMRDVVVERFAARLGSGRKSAVKFSATGSRREVGMMLFGNG